MAILQLSRITNRKGIGTDLPQLAGAEFGWALDERRLFIGNGTIVDGAPVVGNTEILTEFSDILSFGTAYTYKGEPGYVIETGPLSTDILRSLQEKFDDFVSVRDFGAVGGGVVDDTDAINRALFELFCRGPNVAARKSLFFPADVYRVTGKIKVPPHAKLWGEGLSSSLIKYIPDVENATAMVASTLYKIVVPGTTDFTLVGAPNNFVGTVFTATGPATGDGTVIKWIEEVVVTSDSLQQIGINIGAGADFPTGIEMVSMGIHSEEENTLLKLDSVTDSGFHYIGLEGPATFDRSLETAFTSAIEIANSNVGPVTNDITISKIVTKNTTYGLRAEGNVKGVVLETSGLSLHYKGVYITNETIQATSLVPGTRYKIIDVGTTDFVTEQAGSAEAPAYNREGITFTADAVGTGSGTVISMDDLGATGVVVSRSIFDNIARQGVHYENTLFNSTSHNVFYNVAYDGTLTPVIDLETDQCVSVGDLFQREDEAADGPRIALRGNGGLAIDSAHSIHLGSYERQVGIESEIPVSTTGGIFTFASTQVNSYRVDYSITRNAITRMGRLYVSNDNAVTFDDEYTESAATGVTLNVVATGLNSELQFTSDGSGGVATINFSVVRLD